MTKFYTFFSSSLSSHFLGPNFEEIRHMSKWLQPFMLLMFIVVAVCGCAEATQELIVGSSSRGSEISEVLITIDPEQLFQRIDGFGAFGSQTVPWDRKSVLFRRDLLMIYSIISA